VTLRVSESESVRQVCGHSGVPYRHAPAMGGVGSGAAGTGVRTASHMLLPVMCSGCLMFCDCALLPSDHVQAMRRTTTEHTAVTWQLLCTACAQVFHPQQAGRQAGLHQGLAGSDVAGGKTPLGQP
jgi:hypothetical protein